MAFLLRDNQPTVVHCDTDVLRATLGIQEYLALPTVVSHPSTLVHPRTGFTRDLYQRRGVADNDRPSKRATRHLGPDRLVHASSTVRERHLPPTRPTRPIRLGRMRGSSARIWKRRWRRVDGRSVWRCGGHSGIRKRRMTGKGGSLSCTRKHQSDTSNTSSG
jgi:hypothetical protein